MLKVTTWLGADCIYSKLFVKPSVSLSEATTAPHGLCLNFGLSIESTGRKITFPGKGIYLYWTNASTLAHRVCFYSCSGVKGSCMNGLRLQLRMSSATPSPPNIIGYTIRHQTKLIDYHIVATQLFESKNIIQWSKTYRKFWSILCIPQQCVTILQERGSSRYNFRPISTKSSSIRLTVDTQLAGLGTWDSSLSTAKLASMATILLRMVKSSTY